ncbi:hypothetical protein HO173_008661 [Letharia columbiana]|uniref:DUF7702 domain-containing protein n=1 Tax=Letharia columbiana TaxID=112416 RepID=A0A8H6FR29_9LECA|nr:uncharacterized protein HO173_008661 [Letharia columbiana]KAF6233117.1 hypothetical protein HO173_008661 [Letharia columbiana]
MPSPSESLDIAELAIYLPLLSLTLFVVFRHGIHRQSGWIYLAIFCLIRIIGAALGIAAEKKPSKVSDLEWSAILGSVGISPLLLASLGLLKRITDETTKRVPTEGAIQERSRFETVVSYTILGRIFGRLGVHQFATSYRSRFLQLLQIPAAIALIICIVGGSDLTDSSISEQSTGKKLIKAGLIIFLIIYICLFLLIAKSASQINGLPSGEKRVLSALIVALPLLGVRILFSLLAYFSTISTFSPINGNVLVRAFMAIFEEILIVIVYTLAGILVPKFGNAKMDDTNFEIQHLETRASTPARHAPQQGSRVVV